MATGASVESTVGAVERVCATAESADALLEGVSDVIHRALPHDGATWFGVDPVTMLPTAPSRVEGLDPAFCDTYWHLEFHEQDTALFADLARGDEVLTLRAALDDRPARSIRYRDFMKPQGYEDELRGVLRAGGAVWGFVGLYRDGAHDPFDQEDAAVIQRVGPVVGAALRSHIREVSPWLGQPSAPGLIVIDRNGRAVSANHEALGWLREMWPAAATVELESCWPDVLGPCNTGIEVPTALFALVARARAVAEGRERSPARLRLRDRRGRWLVLHASPMAGPGDARGESSVAVVIEAAKSAEIAPIIIEAYSLTARERDVLGAVARGGSTAEIAAELFLSPHTVRDYIKAVFEKLGVSSRSELVARLYGEHYSDRLHETIVEIH